MTMQDRIDRYVRNEMDSDERICFEDDLRTDERLRKDYELTIAIADSLKRRRSKYGQMSMWDAEYRRARRRRLWIGATAAASVLACILVGVPHKYNSEENMLRPGVAATAVFRSASGFHGPDSCVASGDFKGAAERIEMLIGECSGEIAAIEALQAPTEREEYKKQIAEMDLYNLRWYRIQVLVAMGDTTTALEYLEQFRTIEGDHRQEADSLFRSLR